jgi:ribosomal-protein-alanine N-acetyltransferase
MTKSRRDRSSWSLRAASLRDVAALAKIDRRSFRHEGEIFDAARIRRLIANPRAVAVVAECDGAILGWAVGLVRRTARGLHGRLYGVAVDPSARGLGLGRALTERVLAALRRRDCRRLALEVRLDNDVAVSLYESLGFEADETIADYYAPGVHALRMRRAE